MANSEERIKQKMLEVLERAIDDPLLIDPEEWKKLFGAASMARAMSIVSKLKGRPADDAETLAENHDPLTPDESSLFAAWLEDGITCKNCGNRVTL